MAQDLDLNEFFNKFASQFDIPAQTKESTIQIQESTQKQEPKTKESNIEIYSLEQKTIVDKMKNIVKEIDNLYVERTELIHIMALSLITETNLLMLGLPGSAKTDICNEFCSRIQDAKFFSWMLNKTSDPSEILGPTSIKGLEQDEFRRITTGKLPQANIVFLDEVFKSNAPVLNTLLTIMNEHYFFNNGKKEQIPLISLFGASNEMPEEDEGLEALYDRFLFRYNVEYVKEVKNLKTMFSNYLANRSNKTNQIKKTILTFDELKFLQNISKNVAIPKNILNTFIRIIGHLKNENIIISDRRKNECLKILQGAAVLDGRATVAIKDLESLIYAIWTKPEQIPAVEKYVYMYSDPYSAKLNAVKDTFNTIIAELKEETDKKVKVSKVVDAKKNIDKLITNVNSIISNESNKDEPAIIYANNLRSKMLEYIDILIQVASGDYDSINKLDNFTNDLSSLKSRYKEIEQEEPESSF